MLDMEKNSWGWGANTWVFLWSQSHQIEEPYKSSCPIFPHCRLGIWGPEKWMKWVIWSHAGSYRRHQSLDQPQAPKQMVFKQKKMWVPPTPHHANWECKQTLRYLEPILFSFPCTLSWRSSWNFIKSFLLPLSNGYLSSFYAQGAVLGTVDNPREKPTFSSGSGNKTWVPAH